MEYHAILLGGTSPSLGGRMLSLPRLRTSATRAGFNVLTVDFLHFLSQDEIIDILKRFVSSNTKVIGFSLPWHTPGGSGSGWINEELVSKIRGLWPEMIIITGNQNNLSPITSDYHFSGMSDYSFVEFLKKVNGQPNNIFIQKPMRVGKFKNIIDANTSNPVVNLDDTSTEFSLEDNINPHDTLPLEISRGCVFSCAFCKFPNLGKKHNDYIRSAANIAEEIKRNYDLFGITRYNIVDNTFNDNMFKLEILRDALSMAKLPKFEFCAFIKPETLATKGGEMIPILIELGLVGAYFGVESLDNESRRAINKGMDIKRIFDVSYKLVEDSKRRVKICASMIIGLPNDTVESVHRTRELFVKEQDRLYRQWLFYALDLRQSAPGEFGGTISAMEKDPLKYGYNIAPGGVSWTSKFMDHSTAVRLMISLRQQDAPLLKAGGWSVTEGWFLNKTEQEQLDLPTGSYWNEYVAATTADAKRRYAALMNR